MLCQLEDLVLCMGDEAMRRDHNVRVERTSWRTSLCSDKCLILHDVKMFCQSIVLHFCHREAAEITKSALI